MSTKNVILPLICVVFLAACGGVTPVPVSLDASPTSLSSTVTPFLVVTEAATAELTPWSSPTPETVYGYSTPEPAVLPTCNPSGDCLPLTPGVQMRDFSFHELYVGKYVVRNWCTLDQRFSSLSPCAVTISSNRNEQIEVWGYPAQIGKETGADLTGNGTSNIVVINSSGGNCCVGTMVYEAGDHLKKIMDIGSYRVGTFANLNEDGSYEYVTPYRIWSEFCSLCSVVVLIVYEYQGNDGYVLATDKYMDKVDQKIQINIDTLLEFENKYPGASLQFENDNYDYVPAVNSLYRLVVYYLLAGEQDAAWGILTKYFSQQQASEYMLGFEADLVGLMVP